MHETIIVPVDRGAIERRTRSLYLRDWLKRLSLALAFAVPALLVTLALLDWWKTGSLRFQLLEGFRQMSLGDWRGLAWRFITEPRGLSLLGFLIFMGITNWFLLKRGSRKVQEKIGNYQCRFTDDHLEISAGNSQSLFPWSQLKRVRKGPEEWTLVFQGTPFAVPTGLLTPGIRRFIEDLESNNMPRKDSDEHSYAGGNATGASQGGLEFQTNLTPETIKLFLKRDSRKRLRPLWFVYPLLPVVFAIVFATSSKEDQAEPFQIMIPSFLPVVGIVIAAHVWMHYRATSRRAVRSVIDAIGERNVARINDDTLEWSHTRGIERVSWEDVDRIDTTPEYRFIQFKSGAGLLLPEADISTEAKEILNKHGHDE